MKMKKSYIILITVLICILITLGALLILSNAGSGVAREADSDNILDVVDLDAAYEEGEKVNIDDAESSGASDNELSEKSDNEVSENEASNAFASAKAEETASQNEAETQEDDSDGKSSYEITTKGALIWPLKDLSLYAEAPAGGTSKTGQNALCTIPAGTSLVVDKQVDDYFYVSYKEQKGCIDGRYCLINLQDYLKDNLKYNITNSYSSIFMAHDYSIYGITGTVVPGYEKINQGDGKYLVPFLYPCAKKLSDAASLAKADGYILKIYDAFRPHETTRFIYDTTSLYLNKLVPLKDESGKEIFNIDKTTNKPILSEAGVAPYGSIVCADGSLVMPDMTQVAPAGTASGYPQGSIVVENGAVVDALGNVLGTIKLNSGKTYADVITGGKYSLSAFLAKKSSAHNRGIALDLTLCDLATGEELKMQTAMHDLSYHSVLANNNDNANLLASYMKAAGFNDLVSEWWHFQDDDTRNALGINFVLENGVKK